MTGAIKIVTREADGESWAKAAVGYGSFNELTVRAGGGTDDWHPLRKPAAHMAAAV
ncbi:MAG: hypothetical protein AB8B57_11870 [Congregibacter sp.]